MVLLLFSRHGATRFIVLPIYSSSARPVVLQCCGAFRRCVGRGPDFSLALRAGLQSSAGYGSAQLLTEESETSRRHSGGNQSSAATNAAAASARAHEWHTALQRCDSLQRCEARATARAAS